MSDQLYKSARMSAAPMVPIGLDTAGTLAPQTDLAASGTAGRLSPAAKWLAGAAALVILNAGLIGANLHRFGVPPFEPTEVSPSSSSPAVAAPSAIAPAQPSVSVTALEAALSSPPAAPVSTTTEAVTLNVVAEPRPLMAVIGSAGKLMVAGDVPTQEIADALVARATAVLPGGADAVIADLSVHPDALADISGVPVMLWEPAIFAPASSALAAEFTPILDLGAELLAKAPHLRIEVEGHASPDGAITPNLFLSAERVAAVITYLTEAGVSEDQIITAAFGESNPLKVAPSGDASLSDPSRRVETFIINLFEER